jgi:hypothetical protein
VPIRFFLCYVFFFFSFHDSVRFCYASVKVYQCCLDRSISSGFSSGAITGIVFGALCCVGVCVSSIVFFYRKRSLAPLVRDVELHPSPAPATVVEGEPFDWKAVPEGQSSNNIPRLPNYEELEPGSVQPQVEECEGTPSDPSAGEVNQLNIAQVLPVVDHFAAEA